MWKFKAMSISVILGCLSALNGKDLLICEPCIKGPRIVPISSINDYTYYSNIGSFLQDVDWYLLGPNSGQVTSNGIYSAPDHPGIYTLRASSKNAPGELGEIKIEVRDPSKIGTAWKIGQLIVDC